VLIENRLFGVRDKVADAIERIRTFCPPDGYYLAFSGGKDSQCIYHLAVESGVKFTAHYNLTTVDPPELVRFIKREYPDVSIDRPEYTMWELIEKKKMLPTRMIRFCCEFLKERQSPPGSTVMMGVRRAESANRSKRKIVEKCYRDPSITWVSPIVDWEDEDVWEYIRGRNLLYCKLYDEGFTRLGCIMCPMSGPDQMRKEGNRWPRLRRAYVRSCDRAIKNQTHSRTGKKLKFSTGEEMVEWWISGQSTKQDNEPCFKFD